MQSKREVNGCSVIGEFKLWNIVGGIVHPVSITVVAYGSKI